MTALSSETSLRTSGSTLVEQSFSEGLREKTVSGEETVLGTVSRATPFFLTVSVVSRLRLHFPLDKPWPI